MTATDIGCSTLTFHMLPLDEALERVTALGFSAIDLAMIAEFCAHADPHADAAGRARVADAIARAGLRVTSINAWSLEFVNDPGDVEQEHIRGALRVAEAVGAPVVTMQPGSPVPPGSWSEAAPMVAEQLNALGAEAEAAGIALAVEAPHMGTFAEEFEPACTLVDLLDPDRVGVARDTSHVLNGGGTIEQALARYGPRVRHVHLRDIATGASSSLPVMGSSISPRSSPALRRWATAEGSRRNSNARRSRPKSRSARRSEPWPTSVAPRSRSERRA